MIRDRAPAWMPDQEPEVEARSGEMTEARSGRIPEIDNPSRKRMGVPEQWKVRDVRQFGSRRYPVWAYGCCDTRAVVQLVDNQLRQLLHERIQAGVSQAREWYEESVQSVGSAALHDGGSDGIGEGRGGG